MATEVELQKIIRQLQEKVISLTAENAQLKQRLDMHLDTPQFTTQGIAR